MATRFERDVQGCASHRFAGSFQGDDFGVRTTETVVTADGDQPTVPSDRRANQRVRLDFST